jgi:predicted ATPase/class 3 adenylate cyclase
MTPVLCAISATRQLNLLFSPRMSKLLLHILSGSVLIEENKIVHPLIPEFILKNYAEGITGGSFSAVGVFVDISGFSAMTDTLMEHGQHGAEILAEVMRSSFKPLIQSVYEQGGFVIAQSGDAFHALFPLDPDPGDAVYRALTAVWYIRARAAENNLFNTAYGSFSITVKVGVASGDTAWGIIQSIDKRRAAYFFQGSAVDGSAEAEHYADPGLVIVNPAFQRQAERMAAFELAGDYYRLIDLTLDPSPSRSVTLPKIDLNFAAHFYPRDLYLQQQSGEFRRCTNLFVRIPTVRTETQLRIFMQTIFELQDQYGGLLELRFGDKGAHLLLIWGAPISFENDVERCLNFIFELHARTVIPINAGVTHRIAHAGFIGSELAEEYTVFGRGVNLAARFMTSAPRGEIWVDEHVAANASRYFEFDYGGQRSFKGFSQAQKYSILIERKEQAEYEYEGKLFGRQKEIQKILTFVEPIFSGNFSGLLIVRGDPGIGKSRLVREILSILSKEHLDGIQIFLLQTDEMIRQPFNPLRYWLRQYFNIQDTQSDARNKRSFNRKLDDLIAGTEDKELIEELDRVRSFLGALVGLFWTDSLYELLEARARYENTIIALNLLLQCESLQKPTILLLEDMQWLDEDSREYLPVLLHAMTADNEKSYPIAVLTTSRFEEKLILIDGAHPSEIRLTQLDRSSLSELATSKLENNPGDSLLDLLMERSEGNPFFAEEMLRYLQENNLLECQPDGCIILSDQKTALPDTISTLLVARLDHLSLKVKEIVQTAAVLGREFDINLLAHMLAYPANLTVLVHDAEQANIWMPLSKTRFIFRHTLMRDAAYSMLILAERRKLHERTVDALESVYKDHLTNHYGELAYHALHAGLNDRARVYFRQAGDAAQQAYQNLLAVEYFSQALALTSDDALSEQFEYIHARLLLYEHLGMTEDRQTDLGKLQSLASQLNQTAYTTIAVIDRATFELDTDAYENAYQSALEAATLAQDNQDHSQLAKAYRYAALALYRMGRYKEAEEQAQNALQSAQQLNEPALNSSILTNLGLIYLDQGKVEQAEKEFIKALEISEKSNLLGAQAASLNNLAQAKGFQGDFLNAQKFFQQSLEISRKTGSRRNEGLVLGNLGWVSANLGDYQSARAYHQENLRISRQTGSRFIEVFAIINLSAASSALLDYFEAVRWAEQALKLARQISQSNAEAWAFTYLGHAWLGQEEFYKAATAYLSALEIRYQLNQSTLAAEPLAGLAQTSLGVGNVKEAYNHLQPILELMEAESTFEGTDEPLRIYHACFKVLAAVNDARANSVLEKGHVALVSRTAQIPDDTIRNKFLNEIPHHREILQAWENKNRPVVKEPV